MGLEIGMRSKHTVAAKEETFHFFFTFKYINFIFFFTFKYINFILIGWWQVKTHITKSLS